MDLESRQFETLVFVKILKQNVLELQYNLIAYGSLGEQNAGFTLNGHVVQVGPLQMHTEEKLLLFAHFCVRLYVCG